MFSRTVQCIKALFFGRGNVGKCRQTVSSVSFPSVGWRALVAKWVWLMSEGVSLAAEPLAQVMPTKGPCELFVPPRWNLLGNTAEQVPDRLPTISPPVLWELRHSSGGETLQRRPRGKLGLKAVVLKQARDAVLRIVPKCVRLEAIGFALV